MLKIQTDINSKLYWEQSVLQEEVLTTNYEWNVIRIIKDNPRQTWVGMGGAFTESSCYNLNKLTEKQIQNFIDAYFSTTGLDYNLGRISIGSNDFCLKPYQYLEDENISNFTIEHDKEMIIPVLKKVLLQKRLTFLASPWSPPKFMKSNQSLENGGKLLTKYYSLYAEYLRKFLDEYKKEGIDIAYITMQNEPDAVQNWESCTYTLREQRNFIYKYLVSNLKNIPTKVLVWDHNKDNLYMVAKELIKQNKKIAGVAYHWYTGTHTENLEQTYKKYPKNLLVHTEGCCGFSKYKEKKWLHDAELLLIDLLGDLNHGMNAYIDWNLLLDFSGGPNWQNNYCKSPIILNKRENNYYLTPIYYYFGHISKYLKPGSIILPLDTYRPDIIGTSFIYQKKYGIVLLNITDSDIEVNIIIDNKKVHDVLKSHTICTYIEE